MKTENAVKRESVYICGFIIALSVFMELVFLILGKWNITVLLGNMLSGLIAALNFFLMGITVQNSVLKNKKSAASLMKISQSLRMLMIFVTAAAGIILPYFNTASVLIPLFFPRIAIAFRPFFGKNAVKSLGAYDK